MSSVTETKDQLNIDIISAIDFVNYSRPWLRHKFLLTLQNYILEHHQAYITTDDAETIIQVTSNNYLKDWFDKKNNIKIEDVP